MLYSFLLSIIYINYCKIFLFELISIIIYKILLFFAIVHLFNFKLKT